MKVLLDTNVISALLRGSETVAQPLRHVGEIVVSSVVVGELLHGYRAGRRYEKNLSVFRRFLAQSFIDVREVGFETAELYGRIQAELQADGAPIPSNDVWIAAQSIEAGAELWSFDAHLSKVRGLSWRRFE